jgi:peptidoglycan/LPS O-acetylase OafA/YrhL
MLRPEIQALRAVAVLLVVVYHLWPAALPGGFVGVDVFFAISGYLITSHLLREVDRTGRVSLPAFWARRARRILPAALTTLLVCSLATIAVVPEANWSEFLDEIRASTLYVQNWHLAATAVDYAHADEGPSAVQHFWSLSAEEQFYLLWPVVITIALVMARRRPDRARRRSIGVVLSLLTALSLAYSIYDTRTQPVAAFFVTPTRAWEFGAGGLLAMLPQSADGHAAVRSALSWAGIAAIILAAVAYSDATPFPGGAALLPVLGPLAVIWAGAPTIRWSPLPALRLAPVQFLGDVSYSVYLWHWPLIILAPFVIRRALDTESRVALILLTLLAAWLTKLLIEDPMRHGALLAHRRARWTFAFAAVGTMLVLGVTASGASRLQHDLRIADLETRRVVATAPRCFGAAARDPQRPCENPALRLTVVPTPIQAERERGAPCSPVQRSDVLEVCKFGVPSGEATSTVALVGDSHALHWQAALEPIARAKRWAGRSIYRSQCPLSAAPSGLRPPLGAQCDRWNQDVLQWLRHHPEVSTIFVSGHRGARFLVPPGQDGLSFKVAGYINAWNALPASVQRIIVLRDVPYDLSSTPACVERAMAERKRPGVACAVSRSTAQKPDPAAVAAARQPSPRVALVDLTSLMCDRRACYPVVGGVLVHRSTGHLTRLFSSTLAPFLQRDVNQLTAPPGSGR